MAWPAKFKNEYGCRLWFLLKFFNGPADTEWNRAGAIRRAWLLAFTGHGYSKWLRFLWRVHRLKGFVVDRKRDLHNHSSVSIEVEIRL